MSSINKNKAKWWTAKETVVLLASVTSGNSRKIAQTASQVSASTKKPSERVGALIGPISARTNA